jgi:hypothetical protein
MPRGSPDSSSSHSDRLSHSPHVGLPSMSNPRLADQVYVSAWVEALLLALVSSHSVAEGIPSSTPANPGQVSLECLRMGSSVDKLSLRYIARLRRLRALGIQVEVSKAHLTEFYLGLLDSTGGPSTPLQHLSIWQKEDLGVESISAFIAFVRGYSGQLLTLQIVQSSYVHPSLVQIHESRELVDALLSCHGLRRLELPKWSLSGSSGPSAGPSSSSTSSPSSSSTRAARLSSLECLRIDCGGGVLAESDLAALLDEAPSLLEVELGNVSQSLDVLLWVASRCHQLRTLAVCSDPSDEVPEGAYVMDLPRWVSAQSSLIAAMPLLTCLSLNSARGATGQELHSRFLAVTHFLQSSAPRLRWLLLGGDGFKGLDRERGLFCALKGLTHLRVLGLDGGEWMREGSLSRYWRTVTPTYIVEVLDAPYRAINSRMGRPSLWSSFDLPPIHFPYTLWRFSSSPSPHTRGAGSRSTGAFAEEVDGRSGREGFFSALEAEQRSVPSPRRGQRSRGKRRRQEEKEI